MNSTALLTDMYELTMLDAWIREGRQDDPATFEVFTRRLAPGHRYGVVAGTARVLDAIENFTFEGLGLLDSGSWFRKTLALSEETVQFLADYKFEGTIRGYREGDLYFPNSPILQVQGRLADVMLETVILSILNHDCSIAAKAARIVQETNGAPITEMGSRRTHEGAAVAVARAAYIAGFAATSNLQAGMTYGVPVRGTAAHAFTLSHKATRDSIYMNQLAELNAFTAQIAAMGPTTTLLVDTFNLEQGVRNAIKAGIDPLYGAIRIDSGDLAANANLAREILDSEGCSGTRIIATSDLDEHVIKDLRVANAPIDGYGVGTKLVSTPPAGMVYKLVEVSGVPVAKVSRDKVSLGGQKVADRTYDADGHVNGEVLRTVASAATSTLGHREARPLLVTLVRDGRTCTPRDDAHSARKFHQEAIAELPPNERRVWSGDHGPFITAELS